MDMRVADNLCFILSVWAPVFQTSM